MTAPLILSFDTSEGHCAVCLLSGDSVLADVLEPMAKGQTERLLVLVQEVLAGASVAQSSLAAVAVGVGPGNFTGIRIGISAARGLALGLGIPAIGVSRFEALQFGQSGAMIAAVDARRDMAFAQGFETALFAEPALVAQDAIAATGVQIVGAGGSAPLLGVAEATARVAARRLADKTHTNRPSPLYLRAADAAPPRDAPPRIL